MRKNNLTGKIEGLPAVPATFMLEELWNLSEDTKNHLQEVFERLNAYEQTGFEPEEIPKWIKCRDFLPEELPENKGKKVIPCLVAVESRYPKGKPSIEKRQRQWKKNCDGEFQGWEWSRSRCDNITRWMRLPNYPEYK